MPKQKPPKAKPRDGALPPIETLDQAASNIRLAEGGTMAYWVDHGIRPETLKKHRIGWLVNRKWYTIPYFDSEGELVGVHLLNPHHETEKDKWKWVKGSRICPWPANMIERGKPLILCEGESDTLRLRQMGLNALGIAGCANMRVWEAQELTSACYGNPCYLSLDGDQQGQIAYTRAREMLKKAGAKPMKVTLPDDQDVCSFIKVNGEEAFLSLLSRAKETTAGYQLLSSELFDWPSLDWEQIVGNDDDDLVDLFWKWYRPATAAASAFIVLGALTSLATFLRRRIVWPQAGTSHVHGNLYVMLIADSGQYKGDVANATIEIVDRVSRKILDEKLPGESCNYLLPTTQTPEALHNRLGEQPYGLSVWEESAELMSRRQASYMNHYREQIIRLYDVPPYFNRETVGRGLIEVRYPVVSVLSCVQPAIIDEQVPNEVLVSGFLPRFCLAGAGKYQSEEHWHGMQRVADVEHRDQVVNWLFDMVRTFECSSHDEPGIVMTWEPGAQDRYLEWVYENHRLELDAQSSLVTSAYRKMEKHFQKFCLLFSVAAGYGLTINKRAIERAEVLIGYQREVVERILTNRQDTKYAAMKARVVDVLRNTPGGKISRSILLQKTHMSAWDLDNVLDTMVQADELEPLEVEITGSRRANRGARNPKSREAQERQELEKLAAEEAAEEYAQAAQEPEG